MGLFTKDIETMEDLLLHGLKDIYYAENRIIKSLPKLIEKATNRDLTKGLKDHLEETKSQVARLDQVFKKLGQEPKGVRCPAIDGLIDEADEVAGEVADKDVLDAAIVGSAQAVEHYEIARYGTPNCLGRKRRPRRHRASAQHQSQGGEGGRQEALDRGGAQRRQSQGCQLVDPPRISGQTRIRS
jgi:ferritin-like metal-binding protein YciE